MHLSNMGAGSRPLDRGCIVHHRMKDMLKKHNTLCGGLAKEGLVCQILGVFLFLQPDYVV
jgi:hypothetical protein